MNTLKDIRETLCVAQTALARMADQAPSHETGQHIALIDAMIGQIDLHRPLGPDGVHGDLHTLTCGCEDNPLTPPMMFGDSDVYCLPTDWARHQLQAVLPPPPLQTWPKWAGAEPIDPPDPACECGAPWDTENNQCVMYQATRSAILTELYALDGPLFAAAGNAVRSIRGLRNLDPAARALVDAWDHRQAARTDDEITFGIVTSAVADMIEQAWNIIANVGVYVHTGGWDAQHPSWVDAAKRWRDERYHPWLSYYCTVTGFPAPPNVAWGRARWIAVDPAAADYPSDVQSQMVTSPPTPAKIYMLVSADSGLYGIHANRDLAYRLAEHLQLMLVEVPITADCRKANPS